MKAIKRKILYPVLKLYSPNKTLVAILASKTTKLAYEIVKKDIMNDVSTLTFKIPFNNTLINSNSAEMLVKLENDFFVIKTVKLSDQDKRTLEITCESEFTETKGIKCQVLDLIGQSPEQLFNAIIASPKNINLVGQYQWLGTDIVDTYRAVQTQDSVSVFENWLTMCNKFEAWMEFSTDEYGQKWFYLRKNVINNGKFIRKGQGLKSLDITFDSTGIFTRMYGYGANDTDTGNPINFISENPTGKAYAEDISWFIAMGMTQEEIYNTPRCVQETDYTDTNITDKVDLFRITKEELAKVSVPTITGTIGISDFSVYDDTSITEPILGESVVVINQDINYSITTQIKSIERKYTENPFDITVEISNIIKYNSILKDFQHASDIVTSITSTTSSGIVAVNTSFLQGNINALNTSMIGTVDLTTITDKQSTLAILFEDRRIGYPTYGAIALGTKGLCISNTINTDGTWNWKTFGTSQGFSATQINSGILDASLIKTGILKSSNEASWLNMTDGTFNLINGVLYNNTDGNVATLKGYDVEDTNGSTKSQLLSDGVYFNDKALGIKATSNGLEFIGNVTLTANASTATKLATARNIATSGDVIATATPFDGSVDITIPMTLANVGTAGTYTKVTTDGKGRVTSGTSLSASDIPTLTLSKISDVGTVAYKNTGTLSGNIPVLDVNGKLDANILPALVTSVAGKTGVVTLTSSDVGLGNVNNTSDSNKPISTATQSALDLKTNNSDNTRTTTAKDVTGAINELNARIIALENIINNNNFIVT